MTDKHTHRQTHRQTDSQTDAQTDRETHRHTNRKKTQSVSNQKTYLVKAKKVMETIENYAVETSALFILIMFAFLFLLLG